MGTKSDEPAQNTKLDETIAQARAAMAEQNWRKAVTLVNGARNQGDHKRSAEFHELWTDLFPYALRGALKGAWVSAFLVGHRDVVYGVCITPDGKTAISGGEDTTLRVWDVASRRSTATLQGHRDAVVGVAVWNDGTRAVSASYDRTLRWWDLKSGQSLHTLEGHEDAVTSVTLTEGGKRALSTSHDTSVRLWDLEAGTCLRVFAGHTDAVMCVDVTPDGRYAATAAYDRTIRIWDLRSGEVVHILKGHSDACMGVAISQDGSLAVSASDDSTLRIWNLQNGECLHVLRGHTDSVWRVTLTRDARHAISASADRTLRVWDVPKARQLKALEGHRGDVHGVASTPDGRLAVSASGDRTLRVWHLDWELQGRVTVDWHEVASPALDLYRRVLESEGRGGRPSMDEFWQELRYWGLHWLRPEGVERKLKSLEPGAEPEPVAPPRPSPAKPEPAPQPEPKLEPKPEPKPETRPEPKLETKPEARPEPPVPVEQPAPPPRPERMGPKPDDLIAPSLAEMRDAVATPMEPLADPLSGELKAPEPSPAPVAVAVVEPVETETREMKPAPDGLKPALEPEPLPFDEFEEAAVEPPAPIAQVAEAVVEAPAPEPSASTPAPEPEPPVAIAMPAAPPVAAMPEAPALVAEPVAEEPAATPPVVPEEPAEPVAEAPAPPPEPVLEAPEAVPTRELPPAPVDIPTDSLQPAPPETPTEMLLGSVPLPDAAAAEELPLLGADTEFEIPPPPPLEGPASPSSGPLPEFPGLPPVLANQLGLPTAPPPPPVDPSELRPIPDGDVPAPPEVPSGPLLWTAPKEMEPSVTVDEAPTHVEPAPVAPPPPERPIKPEIEKKKEKTKTLGKLGQGKGGKQAPPEEPPKKPELSRKAAGVEAETEDEPGVSPAPGVAAGPMAPAPVRPAPVAAPPKVEAAVFGPPTYWRSSPYPTEGTPPRWAPGDVVAALYRVQELVGLGPRSRVNRIWHQGWSSWLAVKYPSAEAATTADRDRLVQGMEAWVALSLHPHVVQCHYVRMMGGLPHVFMDFAEGGSLNEWIGGGKLYHGGPKRALQRILDVAIQAARGLRYAHRRNLIHGDFKPGNLMLSLDGTAQISDFGWGQGWKQLASSPGAAAFVSPEHHHVEGEVPLYKMSEKSDVWSWALVLLNMFVGEVTWKDGTDAANVLHDYLEVGTESHEIPRMPQTVATLVGKCFEPDPEKRPKLREAIEILKEAYSSTGTHYRRAEPVAGSLRVDGHNNRAVALLDLGRLQEGERHLDEVLMADIDHLHAKYNRNLLLFRTGRITYQDVTAQLAEHRPKTPEAALLQAWIHLEAAHVEAATAALEEAASGGVDGTLVESVRRILGPGVTALPPLEGHEGAVLSVSAPGVRGDRAVTAGEDGIVVMWDLTTNKRMVTCQGHEGPVTAALVARDFTRMLSASLDRTVRTWDPSTGKVLKVLEGHQDAVVGADMTHDGRLGISASQDGSLKVWDLISGRCVQTLSGHTGAVQAVAMTPDGRLALSGGNDRTLRLWDIESGKEIRKLEGHEGPVNAVAMSPDGRLGMSGGQDRSLRLWDLSRARRIAVLEGHTDAVLAISFNPERSMAASAGADLTLRLWDTSTGRLLRTLPLDQKVRSVTLLRDGRRLMAGLQGKVGVFQVHLPAAPFRLRSAGTPTEATRNQERFAHCMLRTRAAQGREDWKATVDALVEARNLPGYEWSKDVLRLWNECYPHAARSGLRGAWLDGARDGFPQGRALSADGAGRTLLAGLQDGRLILLSEDQPDKTLFEGSGSINAVAMTPDGSRAVSGGDDKVLRLWDVPATTMPRTMEGHTDRIQTVAITPTGRYALSGGWDRQLRLWDLNSGAALRIMEGHTRPVLSCALTPDGRMAMSGGADAAVKLWDAQSGKMLKPLVGHEDAVQSVAITSDGTICASGGNDNTIFIWDVGTGKPRHKLTGHRDAVIGLEVSWDGKYAVSAGWDGTVRIWQLLTGRPLAVLHRHLGSVRALAFTGDARLCFTLGDDGLLGRWILDWELVPNEKADWDEAIRPLANVFLSCHTGPAPLWRATWTAPDFDRFMLDVSRAGYGWLRREGVQKELEKMAARWRGPARLK